MGYYEDLLAAQAAVAREEQELAAAKARLSALEADRVVGGPDVSQYQGDIDWTKVRGAGYDIVFPRVADGDVRDTMYSKARIDAIKAAGLNYAPYYFGRVAAVSNGERNGRSEAAMAVYFAESAGWGKKGDFPLAYDFETLNGQTAAKAASHLYEFVDTYRAIKSTVPIIYTNPATMSQILSSMTATAKTLIGSCPLWIANWTTAASPTIPAPWTDWTFWQYTDRATVAGITTPVDNNRANIAKSALELLRMS